VTLGNPEIFAGRTFTVPPERGVRVVTALLEHVDASRRLRVLDLGCGTGLNTLALAAALPRATVTGVDLSAASIAVAESARRRHAAGDRVAFTAANYLAFPGGPFDVIVSDTVLYAIPASDDALFGKIAGDLVPGGLLLYTMPTDALGNRLLVGLRRGLRRLRGPATDALVLGLARALHGRDYDDALLRERWGFEIVATEAIRRASPAQLSHRLVVARRAS